MLLVALVALLLVVALPLPLLLAPLLMKTLWQQSFVQHCKVDSDIEPQRMLATQAPACTGHDGHAGLEIECHIALLLLFFARQTLRRSVSAA